MFNIGDKVIVSNPDHGYFEYWMKVGVVTDITLTYDPEILNYVSFGNVDNVTVGNYFWNHELTKVEYTTEDEGN